MLAPLAVKDRQSRKSVGGLCNALTYQLKLSAGNLIRFYAQVHGNRLACFFISKAMAAPITSENCRKSNFVSKAHLLPSQGKTGFAVKAYCRVVRASEEHQSISAQLLCRSHDVREIR